MKFKTNIKCDACIAKVTPALDGDKRIKNWEVDLESPDRILTVEGDIPAEEVASLLQPVGYSATPIKKGLLNKLFGN